MDGVGSLVMLGGVCGEGGEGIAAVVEICGRRACRCGFFDGWEE